jgi:hypothetical protein
VHLVFESPTKCMHIVYDNKRRSKPYSLLMMQKDKYENMHHERTSVAFLHTNQTM